MRSRRGFMKLGWGRNTISDKQPSVKDNTYRDNFTGAVEVELDTNKNSGDHHCNDHCACHTHEHVFPASDT